jgi:accessory gene regulator protein AgrB
MTTLFFSGIAFISSIHGSVLADNFRIFFLIVFIISAVVITLWAPAENKNRPIKYEKRKGLKILSYILLVIWALSINAAAYFTIFQFGVLFASTLAVILQSFILSPAGFRLMEYTDSVIKEKEGKTNAQQT